MNVLRKSFLSWEPILNARLHNFMTIALIKNPSIFPEGETNFLIDGPTGNLELLTFASKEHTKGVAVICHPHPLFQGTMHNKVVHTLSRAFHNKGLHTVRFNFRGVGKSEGQFGDAIGEVEDLRAVLHWVDKVLSHPKLWLAGFSFGSYIAAKGASFHPCQQLFSIAPGVERHSFNTLESVSCPWVVIQGEADEVTSPEAVYAWFEWQKTRTNQITLLKIPEASHFFHGKLIILRNLVEEKFVSP